MKKTLGIVAIILTFLLMPGFVSSATVTEDDGFAYRDQTKTEIIKIPNVEKVVIPEGVEILGDAAYGQWWEDEEMEYVGGKKTIFEHVKELYFPSTLRLCSRYYYDPEVFPNLRQIHIAEGNKWFRYKSGVLYLMNAGKETELCRAFPNAANGVIVMPDTVRIIYKGALEGCKNITSLTFSRDFTSVSWYTGPTNCKPSKDNLGVCENLKAYYVQSGNKKYKAVGGVLYSADGAELYIVPQGYSGKVTIPAGTMRVAPYAFHNCRKVTAIQIPYGVTSLSGFSNCDSLTSVKIPSSVKYGGTFENCDNLETIWYHWKTPGKLRVAKNCPKLKTIYIPKGTKAIYKKKVDGAAEKLIKVGNYKPQTKKVKKLQKPKGTVVVWQDASGTISINWKQVLYAEGYKIQMKVGSRWKTVETIACPEPERYGGSIPYMGFAKKLKMQEGSVYYFRIVAYRGSVTSASSPYKVCWLKKPKLTSAKVAKKDKIVVEWKTKKRVDGYKICISGSDGSSREVTVKGAASKKKTIAGVKKGVKYRIQIYTYKKVGNKKWTSAKSNCIKV